MPRHPPNETPEDAGKSLYELMRCCAMTRYTDQERRCPHMGTVRINGKYFCGVHRPDRKPRVYKGRK